MKNIDVRSESRWQKFKKKFPQFEVSFSKFSKTGKKGKAALIIVPVVLTAIGVGVGLGIANSHRGGNNPVDVVEKDDGERHRIYLVASDNVTIPLTVSITSRNTSGEELMELFNLLKTDSKANTNSIKGLIPAATKVNTLEIFNDELILDVSEEFLNYEPSKEVNMLESLVYTFSEYPSINMLSIYVDGERLEKMPQKNTIVPDFLEKAFGINRQESDASKLSDSKMYNIYYTKTYDSTNYLIPVSQYVDGEGTIESQLVSAIGCAAPSGMKLVTQYSYIETTQDDKDDTKINLQLKSAALKEEGLVKKEVYEMVALTMNDLDDDYEVTFTVEGEEMMVEGLINPADFQVSELIYNEIKI